VNRWNTPPRGILGDAAFQKQFQHSRQRVDSFLDQVRNHMRQQRLTSSNAILSGHLPLPGTIETPRRVRSVNQTLAKLDSRLPLHLGQRRGCVSNCGSMPTPYRIGTATVFSTVGQHPQ